MLGDSSRPLTRNELDAMEAAAQESQELQAQRREFEAHNAEWLSVNDKCDAEFLGLYNLPNQMMFWNGGGREVLHRLPNGARAVVITEQMAVTTANNMNIHLPGM